jgi:hypothetical protein
MRGSPPAPLRRCRWFGHKLSGDSYSLYSAYFARCLRKGCPWTYENREGYAKVAHLPDRTSEPFDWLPWRAK